MSNQIPSSDGSGVNGDPIAGKRKINGSDNPDDWFGSNHVISRELGDKIRGKEPSKSTRKTDPDWGLDSTVDGIERTIIPVLAKIKKMKNKGDDKNIVDPIIDGIKERIISRRRGVAPWREWLKEFMKRCSNIEFEKNRHMRMGVYRLSGIRTYGIQQKKQALKKCVVYVDTTGSLYSYLSLLVAEVKKLANDCEFQTVDINTFTTSVIHHDNISHSTLKDDNWGITDHVSGGTDINCVYEDIATNYCIKGVLKSDVDVIIILTDDSGVESGDAKSFTSKIGANVFGKMFYLVFCPGYSDLSTAEEECANYISPSSKMRVMVFSQFLGSLNKYETNESFNMKNTYKIAGRLSEMALSKKRATADSIGADVLNADDVIKINTKAKIDAHRSTGTLDQLDLFKPIIETMKRLFPAAVIIKNAGDISIIDADAAYYISDNADYILMKGNIDKTNIENFFELVNNINIKTFFGNINIDGRYTKFTHFPMNFPKRIEGNFRIFGLSNLRDFSNAPSAVTGRVSINTTSKFIRPAILNAYRNSIVASPTQIDDGRNKPKSFFTMNKTDESFENIIMERIKLGESFMINEMAVAPSLEPFRKPTRARYQKKGEDSTEFDKRKDNWLKNTDIYRKNIDIWMDVIKPIISVGLGDIKENDVTVAKDAMNISKNDVKHIKQGFKIYTTKDNLISAVYCKLSDKSEDKLICLRKKDSDDFITNPDELMNETKSRWNYFKECFDNIAGRCKILWTNLLEGPRSATDKKSTIEENLLNFLFCSLYLLNNQTAKKRVTGNEIQKVLYQFAPENIINDDWLSDVDNADYVDKIIGDILSYLFPGYHAHRIGDSTWQVGPIRKTDIVNLSKTLGNPRDGFIKKAIKSCGDNDLNPCVLFTDDILRGFIVGGSVRNKDEYPIYDLDSVKEASFDELVEWAWEIKDVNIFDTALKRMTVKTITKDKFGDEIFNSGDVMMYFPDRCQKQYYIDVDVDAESVEYAAKKANRINSRAGMYGTIKNYEYDRKTGQRIRKDIVGLDQLNKVSKGNETFSNFNEIFDEIISNRDVYEDAEAALRNAVDVYNAKAKEWEKVNGLVSKFDRSVKLLMSTVEAIRSYVLSNPDEAKLKEKYIEQINSDFADIPELIENIATYEDFNAPENDDAAQKRRIELAKECIDSADAFTKLRGKFKTYFQEISGYNKQIVDAQQRRANKLSSHQTKIKPNSVNPAQSQTVNANVNEIKGIVDDLTNKVKGIMDVANGVDFVNGANRRARGQFQTRDNMVNSVNVELSDALVFGNEIVNNNYDITDDVVKKFKNVDVICNDIISQSSDNLADSVLIDNFVSLINSCYDVNDYKERYYPTEKQSDTTATTA